MTREEKIRALSDYCSLQRRCSTCSLKLSEGEVFCKGFRDRTNEELDLGLRAMSKFVPTIAAPVRERILAAAREAVCGHRTTDYGTPEDNFGKIAQLWSVYKGTDFTAMDVAMMMALLKVARIQSGTATEDSFVDLAGYAACAAECAQREKP